jgi:D-amino-acid dehydrogenase
MSLNIVVIGAGIVGAASAIELLRDGHRVTIVEPGEPGGEQAASFGNGAWLSPASVVPMSMPGLWKKVPGYLMDPLGTLTIRWTDLPRLLPWLLRFLRAGATVEKVEATARALRTLLEDAAARHQSLAAEAGVAELIERKGLLYIFPDRKDFEAEALAWRLRRDNGIKWIELNSKGLHRHEPALADRYRFGALVECGGHCIDPGAYVAALVQHCARQGAIIRRTRAIGFEIRDGRLRAVRTESGKVACDRAVISAGIRSKALAEAVGDRVSLESERGYHVVIANPGLALRTPIMPSDGKMANTLTRAGLRIAGQVELASVDAVPNWQRAKILLDHALRTYPGLQRELHEHRVTRWMGHRPSTPDGLPVLGPASRSSDVIHAFGHGHVGLASGPISGRLVADLIANKAPVIDPAPYSARRFA